jgi:hypothetical protein
MAVSVDDVIQLAGQRMSAAQIADNLGVTRQRIYQIARANRIRLHPQWPDDHTAPSLAKIVTGGIPVLLDSSTSGTVAELLVQADLLARGYIAYTPVTRSYAPVDIIAIDRKDPCNMFTIEVRSARRSSAGALVFNKSIPMRASRYALVVIAEPVVYLPELPPAARRAPVDDAP